MRKGYGEIQVGELRDVHKRTHRHDGTLRHGTETEAGVDQILKRRNERKQTGEKYFSHVVVSAAAIMIRLSS